MIKTKYHKLTLEQKARRIAYNKLWRERNRAKSRLHSKRSKDKAKLLYPNRAKDQHYAWVKANPEKLKTINKKYINNSQDKVKACSKNWRSKNKEYILKRNRIWNASPNGRISRSKYYAKRKRKLGFNPLNKWFEGSVGHHINNIDVVYIPKGIHLKCYCGHNTEVHRTKVLNYYGTLENMLLNKSNLL